MKLEPLGNKLVIEPIKETVSKGGIIIPGKKDELPNKGKVIAIGELVPAKLEGKTIYFNRHVTIKLEEQESQVIIKLEDVHAIIS